MRKKARENFEETKAIRIFLDKEIMVFCDEEMKLKVSHTDLQELCFCQNPFSIMKARGHDDNHCENLSDKDLSPRIAIKS